MNDFRVMALRCRGAVALARSRAGAHPPDQLTARRTRNGIIPAMLTAPAFDGFAADSSISARRWDSECEG